MLIRHQIYVRNDRETTRPSARVNASYVGALLVAGALVLLGCSIANTVWNTDPRPAADPSKACSHAEQA